MAQTLEACNKLVSDSIQRAPKDVGIVIMREMLKNDIRRRNLINPLFNTADKVSYFFDFLKLFIFISKVIYEQSSKLSQVIESVVRSEIGLPSKSDLNIEPIDMEIELSSGTSPSDSPTPNETNADSGLEKSDL